MKLDVRCMQETIRSHTANPGMPVILMHIRGCLCQTQRITIVHKSAIVINAPNMGNYCPCGLPSHKGECRDAAREAQGLEPIRWRP